ncbi:MAG: Rrf2 family transcriptional regulator [Pseudomonadota bacterium]
MRLTKQTSDAIKILVICAQNEERLIKVANIAEAIGATKQVGLKLVNLLARLDYIRTVRGPHGGIRLKPEADQWTVGQVVRDLEAFSVAQSTPDGDDIDAGKHLEGFVDDAFAAFLAVLDQHTIAELAARGKPARIEGGSGATSRPAIASKGGSRRTGRSASP